MTDARPALRERAAAARSLTPLMVAVALAALAALVIASPALAQQRNGVEVGPVQATLIALGYYLSNSPWIVGNGAFYGLYRPLVAGLLVGLILGDPVTGTAIGAAINVLYLGFIAAGPSMPADPSVAGWVGTTLALAGGLDAASALALAAAVGLIGTFIFFTRVTVNAVFAHWADARAERGDIGGVALMNWLPPQVFLFAISFTPVFLVVLFTPDVVAGAIDWVQANAPFVLRGLQIAGGFLPAIGIALNMRFIFRGSVAPYFFIGFVMAVVGGLGRQGPINIVAIGVIGAALAFLHVHFVGERLGAPADVTPAAPAPAPADEPAGEATAEAEASVAAATEDRPRLTRGDLLRSFWLWTFFSHANYNYERLQGTAFAHAMTPIIRRLYRSPEEIRAALRRHLVFFNTEPNWGGVIHGSVIAMEEQRARGARIDDEAINSVKTGLMGPLAGVGDTLTQGTIVPILLSLGIGIAASGNVLGPILYFVLVMAAILAVGYTTYMEGYRRGRGAVTSVLRSGVLPRVITGTSVLGNVVLGALAAQFVRVAVAPVIVLGDAHFDVQHDILDRLLPGLLPLLVVLLTWYLLARRRVSPILLLVAFVAISILGAIPLFGPAASCYSSLLAPFGGCEPYVPPDGGGG